MTFIDGHCIEPHIVKLVVVNDIPLGQFRGTLNLVTHEGNWNVPADFDDVLVPRLDVEFIGFQVRKVEHDNGAMTTLVVVVAQTTRFFLTRCVPRIELDETTGGLERQRGGHNAVCIGVHTVNLAGRMKFDKGGFPSTTIADQNHVEYVSNWLMRCCLEKHEKNKASEMEADWYRARHAAELPQPFVS